MLGVLVGEAEVVSDTVVLLVVEAVMVAVTDEELDEVIVNELERVELKLCDRDNVTDTEAEVELLTKNVAVPVALFVAVNVALTVDESDTDSVGVIDCEIVGVMLIVGVGKAERTIICNLLLQTTLPSASKQIWTSNSLISSTSQCIPCS